MTSAEVARWSYPAALRSIDLLTNLLEGCLARPRQLAKLPTWITGVRTAFSGMALEWAAIRSLWVEQLVE
jgi:hypothetical protein